jgi:hypothetical protein
MESVRINLKLKEHRETIFDLEHNKNSCDVVFVCSDGRRFAHKVLIFNAVPEILDLVCDACRNSHEDVVIHVPDIGEDTMKYCLQELYANGDASMLRYALHFNSIFVKREHEDEEEEMSNFDPFAKGGDAYTDHDKEEKVSNSFSRNISEEVDLNLSEVSEHNDNVNTSLDNNQMAQHRFNPNNINDDSDYIDEETKRMILASRARKRYNEMFVDGLEIRVIKNPGLKDFKEGAVFESEAVVKSLVKLYNGHNNVKMVTKSNSVKRLSIACPCSNSRKSRSLGIRKQTESKYTGCPAMMEFKKRPNGLMVLHRIVETHNHENEKAFARVGSRIAFDWNTTADAIVRDGVIRGKTVMDMLVDMKMDGGVDPLPSPMTISLRVGVVKKMLGTPRTPRKEKNTTPHDENNTINEDQ